RLSGDISIPGPRNSAAKTGAVIGVAVVATISVASDSAASSPISAARAGEEITGGAAACSTSAANKAGENDSTPSSRRISPAISGTATRVQMLAAMTGPGRT